MRAATSACVRPARTRAAINSRARSNSSAKASNAARTSRSASIFFLMVCRRLVTNLSPSLKRQIDRTARRLLRFFHKRVKYDQPPSSRRCLNRPTDSISSGQAHLPQLLAQGSHVRQPNTLRPETLQQFRNSEKSEPACPSARKAARPPLGHSEPRPRTPPLAFYSTFAIATKAPAVFEPTAFPQPHRDGNGCRPHLARWRSSRSAPGSGQLRP